jgi:hypothetical protein
MAMFLLVMVVITVAISGLALATKNSLNSSKESRYRSEGRLLAASGIETLYAKLTDSTSSQDQFLKALKSPSLRNSYFPGWVVDSSSLGATIDNKGNWVNCTLGASAPKENCVKISVEVSQGSSEVPLLILLTADVQAGCLGNKSRCVNASYQQRIRKPQFYDYMQLNSSAIINPNDPSLGGNYASANCESMNFSNYSTACKDLIPAYRWSDNYSGPVYLGDSTILICPSVSSAIPTPTRKLPIFTSIEVNSNNSGWESAYNYRGDTGCDNKSNISSSLPITPVTSLSFPTNTDISNSIASAGSNGYTVTSTGSTVNLSFDSTGIKLNASEISTPLTSIPNNSILKINGGARTLLSGNCQAYGSLTIISEGDLEINCDVTLNNNATSAVALISSNGSVIIDQVLSDTESRLINAVLISINKSVYVKDWNSKSYTSSGQEPNLKIIGTIAGKYQGVYGSYDSISGNISGGFRKDFSWDIRFRDPVLAGQLFPWLPRPITTDWRRLDLTEVKVK